MSGPLDGVTVLDLSRVLAGPYCAAMLGDAGARVIKVEPPLGDDTRKWGPPYAGGESAYYLCCNRNKQGMVLDLQRPEGRAVLKRMARQADVLVENFKLGTMERWGLGYEEVLRPANPRLVYCNISGFGRSGPRAHLPGYDFVIQAMGGLMSITGEPDGAPMKVGVAVADLTTGMMAAFGILAALRHRDRTGVGQRVDLSLFETQLSWLANVASSYLVSGALPRRYGNAHATVVPYQVFQARDRAMVVAVGNDSQFRRLCSVVGLPELPADPRFATNPARVQNREALLTFLEPALAAREADEWLELLTQQGIPCGPINTLDRVFQDPQTVHRELVQEVPHPTAGTVRLVGSPIRFSETPAAIRQHPPLMGEHSGEVLTHFGFTAEEIASLHEAGIITPAAQRAD